MFEGQKVRFVSDTWESSHSGKTATLLKIPQNTAMRWIVRWDESILNATIGMNVNPKFLQPA